MWQYVFRRVLYNVPVYLGIILFLMYALRINDPVVGRLGKNPPEGAYEELAAQYGLDRPFLVQYVDFLGDIATLDFSAESWSNPGRTVDEMLRAALVPTLAITIPELVLVALVSITIALVSAYFRGRPLDRVLMFGAVIGMSVSYLVYIIFGQYYGAFRLNQVAGAEIFAISGYEPGIANWAHYCLLPILIGTVVAMGYDTRFYRAVMVEESARDYIITAQAKGASKAKVMFVHMLKNAMIPVITRVMTTLPFLVMGNILLEVYFNIPGMGRVLLTAINEVDFPVTQLFTAAFATLFIATNILTDVLYALVDPRVRLS